jgi:hypothetical protein
VGVREGEEIGEKDGNRHDNSTFATQLVRILSWRVLEEEEEEGEAKKDGNKKSRGEGEGDGRLEGQVENEEENHDVEGKEGTAAGASTNKQEANDESYSCSFEEYTDSPEEGGEKGEGVSGDARQGARIAKSQIKNEKTLKPLTKRESRFLNQWAKEFSSLNEALMHCIYLNAVRWWNKGDVSNRGSKSRKKNDGRRSNEKSPSTSVGFSLREICDVFWLGKILDRGRKRSNTNHQIANRQMQNTDIASTPNTNNAKSPSPSKPTSSANKPSSPSREKSKSHQNGSPKKESNQSTANQSNAAKESKNNNAGDDPSSPSQKKLSDTSPDPLVAMGLGGGRQVSRLRIILGRKS